MTLSDHFCAHGDLVREIATYNCRITERLRNGGDKNAARNQYRNAITEIRVLYPEA